MYGEVVPDWNNIVTGDFLSLGFGYDVFLNWFSNLFVICIELKLSNGRMLIMDILCV